MPQEFQVLRCYSCEIFQVHLTKKAKKWACKVCGEKQSLKKAFMIGSSCDCRKLVQKLNMEAGEQKISSLDIENSGDLGKCEDYNSLEPISDEFFESSNNVNIETQVSENGSFSKTLEDCSYIPRKKQKCDKHSKYQTSSDNNSHLSCFNNSDVLLHGGIRLDEKKLAEHSQSASPSKQRLEFDIDYNSIDNFPTVQSNSITTFDKNPMTDNLLLPSKSSQNPIVPKNRGFQLILKAAQKKASSSF